MVNEMGIFGNHEGMHQGPDGDWYPDKQSCRGGTVKLDTTNIEALLLKVVNRLGEIREEIKEINNRLDKLEEEK